MQQYRINYPLLIGLIVGSLVCSGAVYGLWRFQIERKSGWLLSEAEKSDAEKNYHVATQFYGQYLSIHPEDKQVRIAYGNAFGDLANQDDVSGEDFGMAAKVLETTVRDPAMATVPEVKALRRRLVEIYGRDNIRQWQTALDHLAIMLEADPNDAELQVLRAKYLFQSQAYDEALKYSYQLIGYDPKTKKFDIKKATAPKNAQVYSNVAVILRSQKKQPELAEQVMDQLVTANPDSADAFIARARLRAATGDSDGAKADANKAFQLKPNDADVLLFMAEISAKGDDFNKAREFLATGRKQYPDDVRFYQATATLELKDKKYEQAIAVIDEGIKAVQGRKAIDLLLFKADVQLPQGDIEGAKKTVEEMKNSRNLRSELTEYYDARIMLSKGDWIHAAEALSRLRPRVTPFGRRIVADVDYQLGFSYEKLGQPELARKQYDHVIEQDPQNAPALAGLERVKGQMGTEPTQEGFAPWQLKADAELKKPKAEQQWGPIDLMIDDYAKEQKWTEPTTKLVKAQLMALREDYDSAKQMLAEISKLSPEKNLAIYRFAVQLDRVNPKVGPAAAMKTWEKVAALFKDDENAQAKLRIDKADILIALNREKPNNETVKQELAVLTTGIDSWPVPRKAELWGGMATRYLSLGMLDEARQYLNLAADAQPNNLPLRHAIFTLAHDSNDDEAMQKAQDKILQIVGDKNNSEWLYTEARRKLSSMRRQGKVDPKSLEEVRQLVGRALDQRPDWHELHVLLAEIELASGNPTLALKHFDRAEETGRPTPVSVAQHIALLAKYNRYPDAAKLVERIPEASRQTLLGSLYADVLFRSSKVDEAVKEAKAAAEADPTNAQSHSIYSQLLARSVQAADTPPEKRKQVMDEAVKSMQRAVELRPEFPEAWLALVGYQIFLKNNDMAQKTLRDAQLALSGDALPLFLARANEALAATEAAQGAKRGSRWFDAETMYRAVYDMAPDDAARAQQLAAFYLGSVYGRADNIAKATPLINQILKAGNEGKIPESDPNLLWARRLGAKLLSMSGEYKNTVKAETLLDQNKQGGELLTEDKLVMAEILASRPEPQSRKRAIGILEELAKTQTLSEPAEIMLGTLYSKTGTDWQKYRSQMLKTLNRFEKSAEARQNYVDRLLLRGDADSLTEARKYAGQLQTLAPNSATTFQLTVRLASKIGNQKAIRDELVGRANSVLQDKAYDAQRASLLTLLATLLIDLGDLDTAERIYTEMAARDPASVYSFAQFLGMHRSVDKCFQKLNEVYSAEHIPDIAGTAAIVVRDQRDKVGDKFDAQIQQWLDTGLRENPDSITLLLIQADLLDLQQKYPEAAALYKKLLARNDLEGFRRAVVLNNLSFLVALDGSAAGDLDALKLVEEAAQILGPNSDILDTRAVVYMSRKDYQKAIDDLKLSVTDTPNASKYFHKAQAHMLAGENRAALEAWQKAGSLGLTTKSLNRMEIPLYEQLKSKMDQLRGGSVTKAEPLRKAG